MLWARALAEADIPVMRFDYRGMGDSDGGVKTFEQVDADVRVAIDQFFKQVPALREVVLWGLCDAASAELLYAHTDHRVTGLVLVNPWVRTETSVAKAYLKHYYLMRLVDSSLWRKIARGEFNFVAAARSFMRMFFASVGIKKPASTQETPEDASETDIVETSFAGSETVPLPVRMLDGLNAYKGRLLLILSGDDLTAGEFKDTIAGSRQWRKSLQARRVMRRDLPGANHTFSRRVWRDQVASWTEEWVKSW